LVLLALEEFTPSFHDVTETFYNQFTSRREFQRNIHHLLTVKKKSGESLKNYVNYFHSKIALVYNCNEDIVAAAFISGLQVSHLFYKHLMKNDITKIRDILIQAQKYIQVEEATRAASSHSPRQGPKVEKPKLQFPPRKNPSHNVSSVREPARHAIESSKENEAEPVRKIK